MAVKTRKLLEALRKPTDPAKLDKALGLIEKACQELIRSTKDRRMTEAMLALGELQRKLEDIHWMIADFPRDQRKS